LNQPNSNIVSEQVGEENEPKVAESSKLEFVEPTISTPEDVLEATTFFQQPTIEASTV
jgi:hypothetical protein